MTAPRAAGVYLALTALVVAFHLALIFGAPWGHLTMGGRWPGVLPAAGRLTSALSILVLGGLAWIVAAGAGLLAPRLPSWTIRVVLAYLVLGAVVNTITPSVGERFLWLPVILVQLACVWRVARA